MKRILSIFLALLMLFSTLVLVSCDDDEDSSNEASSSSKESSSESSEESSSESSKESSSSSEESSSESSSSEESSSSSNESTSSSSSSSESSSSEKPQDPADIIDPDEPEAQSLKLFENGESDYVIVYDTTDEAIDELARALKAHIKAKYNIDLELVDKNENESEHEIVLGACREIEQSVAKKLNEQNDFAIYAWGDDLVMSATSEYLYDYMLAIACQLFDGEKMELTAEDNFIYHKSKYKATLYAQYVKGTCPDGIYNLAGLLEVFEGREFIASDKTKLKYRLYVPSSYDPSEEYPVVIFLHGAGERGSDNQNQLRNMLPYLFSIKENPYHEAIIIAPQCPGNNQWVDTPWGNGNYSIETVKESNELKAVVELIGELEKELSTDKSRYYGVGLSMGGFGTWDLAMRHTELFAAVMPICGGADVAMAEKLSDLPIRTFHGSTDTTVPPQGTRDMVYAIRQACAVAGKEEKIVFTLMSGGHTIWDKIATDRANTKWLFNQSKSQ